jgi:hypothetical protein
LREREKERKEAGNSNPNSMKRGKAIIYIFMLIVPNTVNRKQRSFQSAVRTAATLLALAFKIRYQAKRYQVKLVK